MLPLKALPAVPLRAVVVSRGPVAVGVLVEPLPAVVTLAPLRLVSRALTLGVPQPVGVS